MADSKDAAAVPVPRSSKPVSEALLNEKVRWIQFTPLSSQNANTHATLLRYI